MGLFTKHVTMELFHKPFGPSYTIHKSVSGFISCILLSCVMVYKMPALLPSQIIIYRYLSERDKPTWKVVIPCHFTTTVMVLNTVTRFETMPIYVSNFSHLQFLVR